jgi:CheY-like chemotaxis protein
MKNTSIFCPLKENIEINVPHYFRVYIRKENIDNQIYVHLLFNFVQKPEKKEEKETIFDDFKQSIFQLIAHEFKTPLISIISYLEKVNSSDKEVEIPKIKQLTNYMIYLVNNLIEYATKNNIKLALEEISVESFLDFGYEILLMILNYHEKNKKIKLRCRIDKKIRGLKVLSDKHRLLQIIFTLSSVTIKNCRNGFIIFQAVLGSDGNINVVFSCSCSHFNSLRFNKINSSNDPRNLLYGLDLSQKIANLLGTQIKFGPDSLNKCGFSFEIKNNRKASLIYKKTKENFDEIGKITPPKFIKQNLETSFDESYFNSENSQSIDISSENKETICKIKNHNGLEEIKENSSSSRTDEELSFVKIKIEDMERITTKKNHNKEKNFHSKFMSKDTIKLKSQLFIRPPDSSNRCNTSNSYDASDKVNTNSSAFPHSYPKPIRNKSTDAIKNNFRTNEDINLPQKHKKFFSTRGSFHNIMKSKKTIHFPDKEELHSFENKKHLKNKLARKSSGENKRIHEIRYSINHIEIFTILIIDDYRFCRGLLENIISQLIFPKYKGLVKIEQGNDGVCLLYKYINHLDDLENIIVFIDEDMEFMKGSEAVAQIRKWEKERNISSQLKITSITAFNDEMTRMKIKESGVDYVLQKPPKKSDINEIFTSLGIYEKCSLFS